MTKKSKTPQNSTHQPKLSKTIWEDYFNMTTFKMSPVSDVFLEKLAADLCQWALHDEEALKLNTFFAERGIHQHTAEVWRKRNKKLDSAYSFAKQCIGDRREMGGLKRKLDSGMVSTTMAHYDSDWKALAEWRAKLKAETEGAAIEAKVVVLERFPEVATVLPKKDFQAVTKGHDLKETSDEAL